MTFARTLIKLREFQGAGSADTLSYAHPGLTGSTVKQALDFICAVLRPNSQTSADTFADLPTTGNAINDYRIVLDDGDGRAAGYRWEQREGDVAPTWHKIHDMDWSNDAILSSFIDQTLDLYVSKYGRQDLDDSGNPITGLYEGQSIYGGASSGNLTLYANGGDPSSAPEDQTGYVQFGDDVRPTADDAFDLGTALQRFRDLYVSGVITDGTDFLTIAEAAAAYIHSQVTSGNPHNTSYNDLSAKLGTLTLSGDATGSVDLSTAGAKSLAVTVLDDSHTHSAGSTITGFDTEVYEYLKTALIDTEGATWVFDDTEETIEVEVAVPTNVADPAPNKILVGNTAGDEWIASSGPIILDGDVSGSATYDSATDRWYIENEIQNVAISALTDFRVDNKLFSSTIGNPTILSATNHGLLTGEKIRINLPGELFGVHTITYINPNTFSIPVNSTVLVSNCPYLPQGAHFSYNPVIGKFEVAKEFENIRLGELSGLSEDVLTQYVAKDGRTTGQLVKGGISASECLDLESTAHATKGTIRAKDTLTPFTNASYSSGWTGTNLGSSTKRWNNVYAAGEFIGIRVENVSSLPFALGTEIGRLVYYNGKLYHNTGTEYIQVGSGSATVSVRTESSNTLISNADDVLIVNTIAGSVVVTLPPPVDITKRITIKKLSNDNTVNIDGFGFNIDGSSNVVQIFNAGNTITLVSNGTEYFTI